MTPSETIKDALPENIKIQGEIHNTGDMEINGEKMPKEDPKTRTVKDLTIEQLKALAYDELAQLQQHQTNLNVLNQEIASRSTTPAA